MTSRTVSIIIPIYNAEKTLPRCVDSILSQTFRDFTLILVDDGSKDDSGKICDEYAEKDSRVKVIHKENGGVSSARNAGLDISENEYITFLDADDAVPNNYLSCLYGCMIANSADIAVCDVVFIRNGAETMRFSCPEPIISGKTALEKLLSRKEINSGPYAKLFRSGIIGEERFPPMKAYEDMIFNLKVFCKAEKVACCHTEYHYIDNPQGAMAGQSKMPSEDIISASEQIAEYLTANRSDFTDEPFYATASHLMSYVYDMSDRQACEAKHSFLKRAIGFYKTYRREIQRNNAFSFKEKLLYLFVSHQYLYRNGRIKKL